VVLGKERFYIPGLRPIININSRLAIGLKSIKEEEIFIEMLADIIKMYKLT